MKKIIFLFLIVANVGFAQKQVDHFELQPNGFPDYVVLEFEGLTASDIYSQIKRWAEYNIRNTEASNYSEIQNEYLTYSIVYRNAFPVRNTLETLSFDAMFDVELRFRDGRMRIDLGYRWIKQHNGTASIGLTGGITSVFKKDGSVRKYNYQQDVYTGLNELANDIVLQFEQAVIGKVDYKKEDW